MVDKTAQQGQQLMNKREFHCNRRETSSKYTYCPKIYFNII